jgi:curved DNA-binding protein CbpA
MAQDRRAAIQSYVERAFAALDRVDYYRLLGVSSAADDEEIRSAYYRLAANLHPDVHGLEVAPDYRRKLTAVFSRVAEAYKVLSRAQLRARYDRELANGRLRIGMGAEVASSEPKIQDPAARRFYKLAQDAINAGERNSAIMNLKFALQKEPDNPHLQRELATVEKGKR